MNSLSELYAAIGGDFDEVMMRLGNETRIKKFLSLFLKDPSFAELQTAVAAADWETAFRAAHTMKGVAGNMSFTRLRLDASELTEALRGGVALQNTALYDAVCEDYKLVSSSIQDFIAQNS